MTRVCPERDAECPHGDECPFAIDRYSCNPLDFAFDAARLASDQFRSRLCQADCIERWGKDWIDPFHRERLRIECVALLTALASDPSTVTRMMNVQADMQRAGASQFEATQAALVSLAANATHPERNPQ